MIQLLSSHGKKATIILNPGSTFDDLQEAIVAEFGIPKNQQKLAYSFPRQELKPPEVSNEALPLRHRDKVFVEELPKSTEHVDQQFQTENLKCVDTFQDENAMLIDDTFTGE